MKVQLVYGNVVQHPKDISIGIAILSAVLKKAGHEVDLIDTTFGLKDEQILNKVKKFNPQLIAFSSLSCNFAYSKYVAKLIKEKFQIPTIIGGIHPTIAPEESIKEECFDMICLGEGEEAIVELTESLERGEKRTDIRNIWFKKKGNIIKNDLRPLIQDLDSLPYLDLDIYDYPRYLKNHNMVASFLGSRGCPYQCTYCINRTYSGLYEKKGRYVRYRNTDYIIDEIKNAVKKYDIKRVEFFDDTFTLKKSRVKELCEKLKKEVNLPFHINARINNIDEEMCQYLSEAGCDRVSIGVESGDIEIRKHILKRSITDEQIIEGSRLIKKYGMNLYTYNMIGLPQENVENIRKTIEINRKIQPDFLAVSIFTAYKGTYLYDLCEKNGWLDKTITLNSYYSSTNVKHPTIPFSKLKRIRQYFGFNVFIKYNPKRAFIELIDRSLINFRYYSKLRSLYAVNVMRKSDKKIPAKKPR